MEYIEPKGAKLIPKNNDCRDFIFRMATKAIHKMGDISSDKPDLCWIVKETEDAYYGGWEAGFGFYDVMFPKSTTRPLTQEEFEKYKKLNIQHSNGIINPINVKESDTN